MTKTYFEGWYCSLYNGKEALALIPSFYLDQNGNEEAAVRLITSEGIYRFPYIEDFGMGVDIQGFPAIYIGENRFERHGCCISLKAKDIWFHGKVYFPDSFPEQGPRRKNYFRKSICRHETGSLYHRAYGVFWMNGRRILFYGGAGYIESSKGESFPEKFLWTQCCFPHASVHSIMTVVSENMNHTISCNSIFLYRGKEYSLSSATGAKVIIWNHDKLVIRQDKWNLEVTILSRHAFPVLLPAPQKTRVETMQTIHADVRYECYYDQKLLFSITGRNAGLSWR